MRHNSQISNHLVIFLTKWGVMSIGKRLVEIRKATGLNQTEFAELLGSSRGTYKNYERGAVDPPVTLLVKLCEKYGTNANWLIMGKSKPSEDDLKRISASIAFAIEFLEERGEPVNGANLSKAVATILNMLDDLTADFSQALPLLNTIFPKEP
jgi:transcriptional regulator with XRE-family HTH domain